MSDLTAPYDPNNIFAKILRGEAPCVKLYEDEKSLAFMDIMPQVDGHALVIPKCEATNLLDLPPDYAAAAIATAQKLAAAVQKATAAPGILLAQLNGSAAGQTVFHVHFHILPRHQGLELKFRVREPEPAENLEPLAQKIRAAL